MRTELGITHLGGRAEDFAQVEGSTAHFPLLERATAKAGRLSSEKDVPVITYYDI